MENLSIGDRVSYNGHLGTVIGTGCSSCSCITIKDDNGLEFVPATPGLIKKI